MIYFFPMPYPDESLYSIFVRYNKLTGNNYYNTARELIGNRHANINFYFANNLDYLCNQLPVGTSFTSDYFIQNHTILPIYKPFVAEERFENALNNFKNSTKSVANSITSIGFTTSLFRNIGINYCPICIKEDKGNYGEAYIHRNHQVVGNFICSKHKTFLHVYENPKILDRFVFYDIDKLDINNDNNNKVAADKYFNELLNLSYCIDKLIKYYSKLPTYRITKDKYHSILYNREYYLKSGMINLSKLHDDFTNYYSMDYLIYLQSYPDINRASWIRDITTNRINLKSVHPIRNLLFINFLFGDINDFINYPVTNIPKHKRIYNSARVDMSTQDYNTKKVKHQNKLLTLLEQEPHLIRSQIELRIHYSYKWLSLYEKAWLDATLPKPCSRARNWIERDAVCYEKVHEAIHNILDNNILERITTYT